MEKWSLGYAILKVYTQFAFWLSHRKITVLGKENIPYGKPIIFAPNHQNALMDPMTVLCTNKTQQVWLARADIFHSKTVNAILHFLKILPVYRIRDGKENLGKNDEVFSKVIKILTKKKEIALFPEAAHSGRRQMVSHKKAVPRIAFLAEEKNNFNLDLKIVPVGIYYSHYWHFNRSVLINYGKPISLSDYKKIYSESEHQATMNLKNEIFSSIEKLSLEIKSKEHYENFELLRELLGDSFETKKKWHKKKFANRFYSDKKLIELLKESEKEEPKAFKLLHDQLDRYRNLLAANGIENLDVQLGNKSFFILFIEVFLGIIMLPILFLSFLIFLIPFRIPHWYIQKKVTDETFISTFQFVTGLITHFIYFAIIFIVIGVTTKSILKGLLFIVVSLLAGKFAFTILELWKKIFRSIKYRIKKNKNNNIFNQIEELRHNCKLNAKQFLMD